MSRSICNRFTSRRSRASSSRSSVVSAPARPRPASTSACRTQARSAVSVRSSSRAIVPKLFSLPCTNRTVSALNSGENDRRFLRLCFPMTPSYRTFVRVGVSTKPGQAHLVVGEVYFRVHFLDDQGLVPELLPREFVGRNLFPADE